MRQWYETYGGGYEGAPFEDLLGKTITEINKENDGYDDRLFITCLDGSEYLMYHDQDCCESVSIEDIAGDLEDLKGHPILRAEARSNQEDGGHGDSCTWTFYELATIKGSVTIRWFGTSNGYYSESVSFIKKK
jgi:hypothetical protein